MTLGLVRGVPSFLASVTSAAEALTALAAGADVIDCKDPSRGALGALDANTIREIVAAVAGRVPVSATIGDLAADPQIMTTAAQSVAATGVDIVKVGFFGDAHPSLAIEALGDADLNGARLVAVMMADRALDISIIPLLAKARFAGVMLDTADKSKGALPDVCDHKSLRAFLKASRDNGLIAGLAGSLKLAHIPALAALQPDILGFRGALCESGRVSALDATRAKAVRAAIDAAIQDAALPERTFA